jgi:hypothetical protein
MIISCLENIDMGEYEESSHEKRELNLTVCSWKSSPAGVDWELIRATRETIRRKEASR